MFFRTVISIIVFIAVYTFTFLFSGTLLTSYHLKVMSVYQWLQIFSFGVAVGVAIYIYKYFSGNTLLRGNPSVTSGLARENPVNLASTVFSYAIIVGSLGFIGGYFGPIYFMPNNT